ncbi:MAG: hypothetical protein JWO78_1195 [Micavibrio sp.]|nr:hypothetical protein [Micavibrio sp.]
MLSRNKVPLIAATLALIALVACSSTSNHKAPQKPAIKPVASIARSEVVASSPTVPGPSTTSCDYPSEWVGKKIDRDAVKATGRIVRVLRPNDPATMDFSPDRLNVIIDKNDIVTEVKCG